MWNAFSKLKNSSTRCEIGAALIALTPARAVNIGVDKLAVVKKENAIIDHVKKKLEKNLHNEEGQMMLGGESSPLHREAPWRRPWALCKDGDLWQQFYNFVLHKSPKAIKLTKVKGHATKDMVEAGEVREPDRRGNDEADAAAGRGSKDAQPQLQALAGIYNYRHKLYKKFMDRVHRFIVEVRKVEREKRQRMKKEKDPFETKEADKVTIKASLKYAKEDEEAKQLRVRALRREEVKNNEEWEKANKVLNFITNIGWAEKGNEEGGITWLELYIWFRMH